MIRKIIIILAVILVSSATMFISEAKAEAPEISIPSDPKGQISYYADIYGVSSSDMYKVMMCESSGNPTIYGDKGKAYSLFQYHQPTWDSFSKKYQKEYGGELMKRDNPQSQIELTAWAFKKGYQSHWSCWSKIK